MNLGDRATQILIAAGLQGVALHVAAVAAAARELAPQAGVNPEEAETAGWLHDIGLTIPGEQMVSAALSRGIAVLDEEQMAPVLLHGKLSAELARERFAVAAAPVLDAMRCHTTLRAGATPLDKVLFVADKLSWAPADMPDRELLVRAVDRSLDAAVAYLLRRYWEGRERMAVIHPWLQAAWRDWGIGGE